MALPLLWNYPVITDDLFVTEKNVFNTYSVLNIFLVDGVMESWCMKSLQ